MQHQREMWRSMMARSWEPRQWFEDDEGKAPSSGPNRGKSEEDKLMWVYRKQDNFFQVGYYSPNGIWHQDSEWETSDSAAERVHWLNGGG